MKNASHFPPKVTYFKRWCLYFKRKYKSRARRAAGKTAVFSITKGAKKKLEEHRKRATSSRCEASISAKLREKTKDDDKPLLVWVRRPKGTPGHDYFRENFRKVKVWKKRKPANFAGFHTSKIPFELGFFWQSATRIIFANGSEKEWWQEALIKSDQFFCRQKFFVHNISWR